jgi:hypothetical protein
LSDAKKTGSRDISELKQRLGLKKGAAAAPTSSGQRANGAPSGGLVPPPGLNLPPPQPVMPNAADDPFGAMNAMAAVGTVQRAPEIVIVNDGNPVEHVGQKSGAATLLRIVVPAALALVIGVIVGKIGTSNSSYNDGIVGAKAILGDKNATATVVYLKKALSDLDTELDDARNKHSFRPDGAVDKRLKELALQLDVKPEMLTILHQAEHQITDPILVGQLLSFYASVAEIKDMLDQHNKAAVGDDMEKRYAEAKDAADKKRYAVLLSAPTETDPAQFGAKVVEIAGVYCGGNAQPTAKCGDNEQPSGYAYRTDPGATPTKGDFVDRGSDSLPPKKIVPLLPSGASDAILKEIKDQNGSGKQETVNEFYYKRRMTAIYEFVHGKPGQDGKAVGGLLDDGNKLETKLQTDANKGTKFSFFM